MKSRGIVSQKAYVIILPISPDASHEKTFSLSESPTGFAMLIITLCLQYVNFFLFHSQGRLLSKILLA